MQNLSIATIVFIFYNTIKRLSQRSFSYFMLILNCSAYSTMTRWGDKCTFWFWFVKTRLWLIVEALRAIWAPDFSKVKDPQYDP